MAKKDFGTKVGKCDLCGINCWDASGGLPAIWPCSINACPHETPLQLEHNTIKIETSQTGSGLALLLESGSGAG